MSPSFEDNDRFVVCIEFPPGADECPMSSTLKPWKAEHLLGLRTQTDGCIFDSTGGTLKWIAAGRYSGFLSGPSLPHPSEVDITGESAFNDLVATVRDRNLQPSLAIFFLRHVLPVSLLHVLAEQHSLAGLRSFDLCTHMVVEAMGDLRAKVEIRPYQN